MSLTRASVFAQVKPAVEGTLRALRAARDAGVKRVVLTSSFAAIGYGERCHDTALQAESMACGSLSNPAVWFLVRAASQHLFLSVRSLQDAPGG